MRIALVNHTFRPSDGQGHVNAKVATSLVRAGHRVTLVGRDVPEDLLREPLVEFSPLGPVGWVPTTLLKHATLGWRSARVIRRLRRDHDLIVANGGMTFTGTDVNLCHFVHTSWLRSKHHPGKSPGHRGAAWSAYQGVYAKQACWWERDAYNRASRVVAVSDLVRQQLIEDVGVDAEKVKVIENGISPAPEANREKARCEMGVAPGDFVIAFAGDLKTPRKNFDVLLQALRRLPSDCRIVAFGEHEGGPYEALASEAGIEKRVRFFGMRNDVRELFVGADVFALASHYEPFGLVITEAMASGLPIVTSRSVGAASVVERLEAGLVLEDENDFDAIAKALLRLHDNPTEANHFAKNGLRVVHELGWRRIGERYVLAFERALESRGKGQ